MIFMQRSMRKRIWVGLILGIILLIGSNTALAAAASMETGLGTPTGPPPQGGRWENILEQAVTENIITKETAEKVKAFLQAGEEVQKNDFEKIQSLSEEERQAYMEQNKPEKDNHFDKLVEEGILTQSQADAILKLMPINNGEKPDQTKPSQNTSSQNKIRVVINGVEKSFSPAPVNKDGNILVPMRGFFEALGCEVKWDESSKTAIGQKDDTQVKLTINQKTAYVNNQSKSLTSAAQVINGSTYIPLRFVGESLGAEVLWQNGEIIITTK